MIVLLHIVKTNPKGEGKLSPGGGGGDTYRCSLLADIVCVILIADTLSGNSGLWEQWPLGTGASENSGLWELGPLFDSRLAGLVLHMLTAL